MYHLGYFVPRESLVEAAKTRTQRSRYSGLPAGQLRGLAMDTKKAPFPELLASGADVNYFILATRA